MALIEFMENSATRENLSMMLCQQGMKEEFVTTEFLLEVYESMENLLRATM